MTSIRRRLTVSLLAGSVVAFALAGGILHLTVREALVSHFDEGLTGKARALASLFGMDGPYLEFDDPGAALPEFLGGPEPEYFATWMGDASAGGIELKHSATLGEAELPRRAGADGRPDLWDLVLPDGRAGRAVGLAVAIPADLGGDDDGEDGDGEDDAGAVGGGDGTAPGIAGAPAGGAGGVAVGTMVTVVVARSREELDAQLAALVTGLMAAAVAALALIGWGVTWSVGRGLAPVRDLGREVERIDAASLSRRVATAGVPEELTPFAGKLNELLARLESAFAKERRMTAAMAHELRTPIAELRSASDVARRWPDDDAMVDEVLATTSDVALRMSAAVDAVMRYCRIEAGQDRPEVERVELAALLDEQWRPYARLAEERGVRFRNEVPGDVVVASDRGLLAVVVGNLLNNAAHFAARGDVRAWMEGADGVPTLHLANATDQLAPEDMAHVAEPFWRKDAARAGGEHSGLGLTLVTSISAVLEHAVAFTLQERDFVASVGFRAARTAGTPPDAAAARPRARMRGTIT